MVDPVQIILLVVIIVLATLLVVLGVQVFFILLELKVTVKKVNKILDHADSITENIEGPLTTISSLFLGIKAGSVLNIARLIKSFFGKDRDEEKRRYRE